MNNNQSIISSLNALWGHMHENRKIKFYLLFVLLVISSFAEVLSIGAILPFIGAITAPDYIFNHPHSQFAIQLLNINSSVELILPLAIIFIIAIVFSGIIRLFTIWFNTQLSFIVGADMSIDMYKKTLYQPYSTHILRNSSDVISGITNKSHAITSVITSVLGIVTSFIILLSIILTLIIINPGVIFLIIIGFVFFYYLIISISRSRLSLNASIIATESTNVIKALQEGLGGIRDVLIDNTQEYYCSIFSSSDIPMRKAQANNAFIGLSPRIVMEMLGILLISLMAYFISQDFSYIAGSETDSSMTMPILGAIALGLQRTLPLLQQIYLGWATIRGFQYSLFDAIEFLDQKFPDYINKLDNKEISFLKNITISKLSFQYSSQLPLVLKDVSFTIEKGSNIGFIGSTGSGKSPLLDIIMGLLEPTSGKIVIDDNTVLTGNERMWRKNISHVPQHIFLVDGSIAENIAFGIPSGDIDMDIVKLVAHQAQIANFVEKMSNKYDTHVGENGIRMSGGQRQRIGIARALYKRSDILILDEATSALDDKTEKAVMRSVSEIDDNITVLIIAHRLTTLSGCSKIIELNNGSIDKVSSYEEIMNLSLNTENDPQE